ncbi:hypothetical protein Tco_0831388 [Tanacetum coccineum]
MYRFYCPSHSFRIVKTGNAKFLENGKVSGSVENQVVDINKIRDDDPSPMNDHKSTTTLDVVPIFQNQEQHLNNEQTPHEENNLPTQTSKPDGIAFNKPARVRKSSILAIPDDYIVYLQETDFDIGIDNDFVSFSQAIKSYKSEMWIDAVTPPKITYNAAEYQMGRYFVIHSNRYKRTTSRCRLNNNIC